MSLRRARTEPSCVNKVPQQKLGTKKKAQGRRALGLPLRSPSSLRESHCKLIPTMGTPVATSGEPSADVRDGMEEFAFGTSTKTRLFFQGLNSKSGLVMTLAPADPLCNSTP
jgi:hypothetical protein